MPTFALAIVLSQFFPATTFGICGNVVSHDGQPISNATVYVYTATVKVGFSPFCPSCYPDCGRSCSTNDEGEFCFNRLDPTLLFDLLVVAENYEPAFVERVNPLGEKISVSLKGKADCDARNPRTCIRGTVVTDAGDAIAGAVVTPYGCKIAGLRQWGRIKGVDPMAVTNEAGVFELLVDRTIESLDLRVSAREFATRVFQEVRTSDMHVELKVSAGVTVIGRVLKNGKPVPNIQLSISQMDTASATWVGPSFIVTDSNGRYRFSNVMPKAELEIVGTMESVRHLGAIAPVRFSTGNNTSTLELPDLHVAEAASLTGSLRMPDDVLVPRGTRLVIARVNGGDAQETAVNPDGSFSLEGIPNEPMELHVRIPGFHLSQKNISLDPLRECLVGVVSKSSRNMDIAIASGPRNLDFHRTRSERLALHKKRRRLTREPLRGINAARRSEWPEFPTLSPNSEPRHIK